MALSSYRLGDLVLLTLNYKEKLEILNDYPDSIGSEYILKNQYYKNTVNIDLITELVLKKIKIYEHLFPEDIENATVLHLRLGDVISGKHYHECEKRPFSINELNLKVNTNEKLYVIGKCFFCKTSSLNYDECTINSNDYLQKVLNEFHGTHFIGENADVDLCLAVKCKTFIQGKGFFSKLIYEVRKKLNKHSVEEINTVTVTNRGNFHGFFSCCSLKLHDIIEYVNSYKKLPINVDNSLLLDVYKKEGEHDITFNYFKHYNDINIPEYIYEYIDFHEGYENIKFSHLNYEKISPFIKKYFSPSDEILSKINKLEKKYIINYNNICVLFFRGNDKRREIKLPEYSKYVEIADKIMQENSDISFLIQSDETEFIEFMSKKYSNSFYFKDEIRHISRSNYTTDNIKRNIDIYSQYFLAITMIMAKCKFVVCTNGNCSLWIALFRGNSNNLLQLYENHINRLQIFHSFEIKNNTSLNNNKINKKMTKMKMIL